MSNSLPSSSFTKSSRRKQWNIASLNSSNPSSSISTPSSTTIASKIASMTSTTKPLSNSSKISDHLMMKSVRKKKKPNKFLIASITLRHISLTSLSLLKDQRLKLLNKLNTSMVMRTLNFSSQSVLLLFVNIIQDLALFFKISLRDVKINGRSIFLLLMDLSASRKFKKTSSEKMRT